MVRGQDASLTAKLTPAKSSRHSHSNTSTVLPAEPIKYDWIDGVERLERYEPGGYHPIMINDLLHDRYRIVDKLGFGGYSTVWLAQDARLGRYVAIKVGISGSSLPRRERVVMRQLSTRSNADDAIHVPRILDEFDVRGPNGTHACYTLASAQGNLKQASYSRLFPIQVARVLAAKLALAVALVHSRGLVHGDIHLGNVLVKLPSTFHNLSLAQLREQFGEPETIAISRVDGKPLPSSVPSHAVTPLYLGKKAQKFSLADAQSLVLSDFGESFAPASEQRLGRDCNTPVAKRAPETLFEPDAPLSYSSDIWSLGTAMWEMLGMKFIFSESETDDEIVAQQIDVLGFQNFPLVWRRKWERSDADDSDTNRGVPRQPAAHREPWPPLEDAFEEFVQKYRRRREMTGKFGGEETQAILELMRGMLKFLPEKRLTIYEVLESQWMVKWALPQLKEAEKQGHGG